MNKQEIKKALIGKVIEFGSLRPFAIEKVHFYDTFIIVADGDNAVPIGNEYLPTLIKYGAVELSPRNALNESELINVYLK